MIIWVFEKIILFCVLKWNAQGYFLSISQKKFYLILIIWDILFEPNPVILGFDGFGDGKILTVFCWFCGNLAVILKFWIFYTVRRNFEFLKYKTHLDFEIEEILMNCILFHFTNITFFTFLFSEKIVSGQIISMDVSRHYYCRRKLRSLKNGAQCWERNNMKLTSTATETIKWLTCILFDLSSINSIIRSEEINKLL